VKYIMFLSLISSIGVTGTITPDLLEVMERADTGETIPILIKPVGRVSLEYIDQVASGMTRDERCLFAADAMKDFSREAQQGIIDELVSWPEGHVANIHPSWIVNAVGCRATAEVIRTLALRDDVVYIRFRSRTDILIEPIDVHSATHEEQSRANAWGVDQIGAPDVWAMGYEGSGILVSIGDTGANYLHVDLHNQMWHDTAAGFHYGWDFADNDPDPMDANGHGSHCAGSVASNGNAGTNCGVAPQATVMALRVGTTFADEQDVWDAFQFSIDHGVDVISTSLGWPQSQSPQRQEWRESEENVLAAGICHSIAAGNEAGNPSTPGDIRTPGDCPPPWLHPDQTTTGGLTACVTVGATDINDNIASFSSVGYSTWMYDAPWFDYPDTSPEIGLIDPDICGPGVNITSCTWPSTTGYTTMSGTSMATPHLAGCMALILNANYELSPGQVDSLLEVTALELGTAGKDNIYGSGRVQILPAVEGAINVGIEESSGTVPASGFVLSPVSPNPVHSSAVFGFYTDIGSPVEISIYDLTGRRVAEVHSGPLPAGGYSFSWNPSGDAANGIYFVRASSEGLSVTSRMTLIR